MVTQDHPYNDISTPLEFIEGAREGLLALKRAGHLLLLWSGRASRALLYDPLLDPFVRAGVVQVDRKAWLDAKHLHRARYDQMIAFVERELPGVFDAIDDGMAGKPNVDLFIDDRAIGLRGGATWTRIARQYGEPDPLWDESPLAPLLDRQVERLNLVPTGTLKDVLDQVRAELMAKGIRYEPNYVLGEVAFWAADRGTAVNLPWFLATDDLRDAAFERYPWTWENVTRSIRHEVGHSVNYAFELWKREDWTATFGDFLQPYPAASPEPAKLADPLDPAWIYYMADVAPGYPQRHPDDAWAEAFACWLDPGSDWRNRYQAGTGGRAKLDYVERISHEVLAGVPTNHQLGAAKEYRSAYRGQTVRQALGLPPKTTAGEPD